MDLIKTGKYILNINILDGIYRDVKGRWKNILLKLGGKIRCVV